MKTSDLFKYYEDRHYLKLLHNLFHPGRGVVVSGKRPIDGNVGIGVIQSSNWDGSWEDSIRLWRKKISLKFMVELGNGGETIEVEPHRLRMLPINDERHFNGPMSQQNSVPPGVDPDETVINEFDRLPDGISWQYLDEQYRWKKYPRGLAGRIEGLFDCGSPHFLYTPGNPHADGGYSMESINGLTVGMPDHRFEHDIATNQILFSDVTDNMTERNL